MYAGEKRSAFLLVWPSGSAYIARVYRKLSMKIIIPVAGTGTRLRPHTYSLPKPLLHVAGRPVITHLLDPVVPLDPEEVIFVVGYRGEQVREYIRANYSFNARFVHQDRLLGLGYALNLALAGVDGGEVLVILGDTVVECDLRKFVAAGDFVLGLRQVADPTRFGIAEVKDNRVVSLEEKPQNPKTNLAVIGLYFFKDIAKLSSTLASHVQSGRLTRGEVQFTDALQEMIESGIHFVPYEVREWYDCGKKETMLETNRHLLRSVGNTVKIDGSVIIPPVFVAPSAKVINAVLGPDVSVSEGAIIRRSIISNSIIASNATVHDALIENSIIGQEAVVKGCNQVLNIGDSSDITPA